MAAILLAVLFIETCERRKKSTSCLVPKTKRSTCMKRAKSVRNSPELLAEIGKNQQQGIFLLTNKIIHKGLDC